MIIVFGVILVVVGIPVLGILRNYAVTNPKLRVTSIGNDLSRHEIEGSQLYIGPAKHKPDSGKMLSGAAEVAERLAGYDKKPPLLTAKDIIDLEALK